MYVGILFTAPYIIYQIFGFISPALYENERKYSKKVIFYSCVLFLLGVLLNYFIIFPLSFRFLATYQVNPEVINTINISSYIDTFILLSLLLGIMSEIPILTWLFAKLGFITDKYMVKYRKHAIVIIMLIAAIITPTVDIFTLLLVFFPIYLLYELSILVVRKTVRKRNAEIKTLESGWTEPYNLDEK
jgi:sec-independent protein translocase protein TatC